MGASTQYSGSSIMSAFQENKGLSKTLPNQAVVSAESLSFKYAQSHVHSGKVAKLAVPLKM